MQYFISFLEGIITFVSPCLLPMLPVYISYFIGNSDNKSNKAVKNSLGFVLGFTLVFVSLGAFAGSLGHILREYSVAVNIVTGLVVLVFGLNFIGILRIPFLNATHTQQMRVGELGFFSSALFGIVFSIGWTPCVGAFLGSALMLASTRAGAIEGIVMLICYSLGLGIPFVISALLIDKLKGTFDFIKKHYRVINIISGSFLIIMGILMMTGLMGRFLALLTVS